MTDRFNGCVVTFNKAIRDDDAEEILKAIKMIKGVEDVTLDERCLDNYEFHIAEGRVKREMQQKLWDVVTK